LIPPLTLVDFSRRSPERGQIFKSSIQHYREVLYFRGDDKFNEQSWIEFGFPGYQSNDLQGYSCSQRLARLLAVGSGAGYPVRDYGYFQGKRIEQAHEVCLGLFMGLR
jgi:hypothetical protein